MTIINTRLLMHPVNWLVVGIVMLMMGVAIDIAGLGIKSLRAAPGDALQQ
jgi:hypothetical protein